MIDPSLIAKRNSQWRATVMKGDAAAERMLVETFGGLSAAIETLTENLAALDYPQRDTRLSVTLDVATAVADLELKSGIVIPQALRVFWEQVGGITLADLENYKHTEFWDAMYISGPDNYCDALHVDAISSEWISVAITDHEMWKEDVDENDQVDYPFVLDLSPDGYHKDNTSGGAPYGLLQSSQWLPIWTNFEWSGYRMPESSEGGEIDFVSYLRISILECAGFQALLGDVRFERIRSQLLARVKLF